MGRVIGPDQDDRSVQVLFQATPIPPETGKARRV
jgi:hypothetical protein